MTIMICYFTLNVSKNAGYMKAFVVIYACSLFGCFVKQMVKATPHKFTTAYLLA